MPASHFGNARGSAFSAISRWWQNWKNRRLELFFDFDNCSEDELKRTVSTQTTCCSNLPLLFF